MRFLISPEILKACQVPLLRGDSREQTRNLCSLWLHFYGRSCPGQGRLEAVGGNPRLPSPVP